MTAHLAKKVADETDQPKGLKPPIIPSNRQYYVAPKVPPKPRLPPGDHEDIHNPMKVSKIEDFSIEAMVGSGNYCEVAMAIHKATGKKYALKIIDKRKCESTKHQLDVLMEKHVLSRLRNELYDPNPDPDKFSFPLVYATLRDDHKLYIVQEALEGGEVWDTIKHIGCLWAPRARAMILQIMISLRQLHQMKIVHRDLKLENVMLRNDGQKQGKPNSVVLIDFGTSLDLSRPDIEGGGNTSRGINGIKYHHWVGTPHFMPPEAVHNRHTDIRTDLWSLGGLIFQLLSGAPPFNAPTDYLVFIKHGYKMIDYPPDFPEEARDLVEKLLQFEPSERLGASNDARGEALENDWDAIFNHPYLTQSIPGDNPKSQWPPRTIIDIPLPPQPIHPKILNKAGAKLYKLLQSRETVSSCHPWLLDVTITPPMSELSCLIQDIDMIHSFNQLTSDNRYKTECVQCQCSNRSRPSPSPYTDFNGLLIALKSLSCDHCASILAEATRTQYDIETIHEFIATTFRMQIYHHHRDWRDTSREDGYWKALSDEYLAANPLENANKNTKVEDESSEESPVNPEFYEDLIEKAEGEVTE